MVHRLAAEQWTALRALAEGDPSTFPRLAAAAGVSVTTLTERSARDGWKKLDFRKAAVLAAYRAARAANEFPAGYVANSVALESDVSDGVAVGAETELLDDPDEDPNARQRRLGALLSRQVGRVLSSAEAERGMLSKTQIDALTGIMRLAEKFEALAQERAEKEQAKSDADVATILKRIDDRIVELARGYAERLVAGVAVG